MKQKVKKTWLFILGAILSLLGFGGCEKESGSENGLGPFVCAYGCPHADYQIVGEVTGGGKPIKGIRVALLSRPDYNNQYYGIDTLYTDASGKINKSWRNLPLNFDRFAVKIEDLDGQENGSWQTKILEKDDLIIKQTKKGDKNWYEGAFTITANANLNKAEE